MIEQYLSLFARSVFVENMVLAFFLGMCSFLAVSKQVKTAIGLGGAVIFVLTLATPVNWAIKNFILAPGALGFLGEDFASIDLTFLTFITFIAVIAALVQLVELFIDILTNTLPSSGYSCLYRRHCSILGASLFMDERDYTHESVFVGSGVGFMLAMVAIAAIREKIRYSNVPEGLRGLGITMLITGLMAMAFMSFAGIQL